MKQEKVEQLVPMLFMSIVSADTPPQELHRNSQLVNYLREMSYLTITLLGRILLPQVAILYIDHARQLFSFEEHSWTHGVLDLLHASCAIRIETVDADEHSQSKDEWVNIFHERRQMAF